jgi:16S rRNA (adenine1518-N6/adenine1519-N6)-dimethyltransferase
VSGLLDPTALRELAASIDLRPSKKLGQNFVHDANTVRRIVALSGVGPGDVVLEVGPGFGSLTLGLLEAGASVTAVEIDKRMAELLPVTAARLQPGGDLRVVCDDALRVAALPGPAPTALVANLPYNVAVPVVLHALAQFPTLANGLVMVQLEVADRLAAAPGTKEYGAPSAKLAWFAAASRVGTVPRLVFWPVPGVESGLVRLTRHDPPASADRDLVFELVDAAFAQRRKMLRSALAGLVQDPAGLLQDAGIDPTARGETLSIADFARMATTPAHWLRPR